MSKVSFTVTKNEIELAVLDFFNDQIQRGYKRDFTKPKLTFSNKDGDIGYFEGLIEFEVAPTNTTEEETL